jgi:hypothetical protein
MKFYKNRYNIVENNADFLLRFSVKLFTEIALS